MHYTALKSREERCCRVLNTCEMYLRQNTHFSPICPGKKSTGQSLGVVNFLWTPFYILYCTYLYWLVERMANVMTPISVSSIEPRWKIFSQRSYRWDYQYFWYCNWETSAHVGRWVFAIDRFPMVTLPPSLTLISVAVLELLIAGSSCGMPFPLPCSFPMVPCLPTTLAKMVRREGGWTECRPSELKTWICKLVTSNPGFLLCFRSCHAYSFLDVFPRFPITCYSFRWRLHQNLRCVSRNPPFLVRN